MQKSPASPRATTSAAEAVVTSDSQQPNLPSPRRTCNVDQRADEGRRSLSLDNVVTAAFHCDDGRGGSVWGRSPLVRFTIRAETCEQRRARRFRVGAPRGNWEANVTRSSRAIVIALVIVAALETACGGQKQAVRSTPSAEARDFSKRGPYSVGVVEVHLDAAHPALILYPVDRDAVPATARQYRYTPHEVWGSLAAAFPKGSLQTTSVDDTWVGARERAGPVPRRGAQSRERQRVPVRVAPLRAHRVVGLRRDRAGTSRTRPPPDPHCIREGTDCERREDGLRGSVADCARRTRGPTDR